MRLLRDLGMLSRLCRWRWWGWRFSDAAETINFDVTVGSLDIFASTHQGARHQIDLKDFLS